MKLVIVITSNTVMLELIQMSVFSPGQKPKQSKMLIYADIIILEAVVKKLYIKKDYFPETCSKQCFFFPRDTPKCP